MSEPCVYEYNRMSCGCACVKELHRVGVWAVGGGRCCVVEVSRALLSCDSCVAFALCISIRSPGFQGSVVPGATTQEGLYLYSKAFFVSVKRLPTEGLHSSLPAERHLDDFFPEKSTPPERAREGSSQRRLRVCFFSDAQRSALEACCST